MTIIESSVEINQSIDKVYTFLADMNNHQKLMPENIYNWSSTNDEARFTVQNMAKLAIKITEKIENNSLTATPIEKPPFDLKLKWELTESNGNTIAKHLIYADLNMMMKMIAVGPLQKLADNQTQKLKEILI